MFLSFAIPKPQKPKPFPPKELVQYSLSVQNSRAPCRRGDDPDVLAAIGRIVRRTSVQMVTVAAGTALTGSVMVHPSLHDILPPRHPPSTTSSLHDILLAKHKEFLPVYKKYIY
jgi:hypothetical protein